MLKELLQSHLFGVGLNTILKLTTTAFKQELKRHLEVLKEKAKQTENPFDDMVVYLVSLILEACDCENEKELPNLKK